MKQRLWRPICPGSDPYDCITRVLINLHAANESTALPSGLTRVQKPCSVHTQDWPHLQSSQAPLIPFPDGEKNRQVPTIICNSICCWQLNYLDFAQGINLFKIHSSWSMFEQRTKLWKDQCDTYLHYYSFTSNIFSTNSSQACCSSSDSKNPSAQRGTFDLHS